MKQIITPVKKSFDEIVKSVATYDPHPRKELRGIKRHKLLKKKKGKKN